MGGRNTILVIQFTVGGKLAMKAWTVPGGRTLFTILLHIAPDPVGLPLYGIVFVTGATIGFEMRGDTAHLDQGWIGTKQRLILGYIGNLFTITL